jgi:hypothetical protein
MRSKKRKFEELHSLPGDFAFIPVIFTHIIFEFLELHEELELCQITKSMRLHVHKNLGFDVTMFSKRGRPIRTIKLIPCNWRKLIKNQSLIKKLVRRFTRNWKSAIAVNNIRCGSEKILLNTHQITALHCAEWFEEFKTKLVEFTSRKVVGVKLIDVNDPSYTQIISHPLFYFWVTDGDNTRYEFYVFRGGTYTIDELPTEFGSDRLEELRQARIDMQSVIEPNSILMNVFATERIRWSRFRYDVQLWDVARNDKILDLGRYSVLLFRRTHLTRILTGNKT